MLAENCRTVSQSSHESLSLNRDDQTSVIHAIFL